MLMPTGLTAAQQAVVNAAAAGGGSFVNTIPGSSPGEAPITVIVIVNDIGIVSSYGYFDTSTGQQNWNAGRL